MQDTLSENTSSASIAERYLQISAALQLADRSESPAEIHGLIIGCINNHLATGVQPALIELLTAGEAEQDLSGFLEVIHEVYRDSSESLFNNDESFDLVMPDDDESIESRTDALADWCQGYMLGLLHNDKLTIEKLPDDGPEIARDILSISQAGTSEEGDVNQDEWALAELQEYVKVGVQLIFEFIYERRSAEQPQTPSTPQ